MNWWQTLLVNSVPLFVALLGWLLYRSRDTQNLAAQVLKSMSGQLEMAEKMRTAMALQAERLSQWERWGREVVEVWNQLKTHLAKQNITLPDLPTPPDMHLDLRYLFEDGD